MRNGNSASLENGNSASLEEADDPASRNETSRYFLGVIPAAAGSCLLLPKGGVVHATSRSACETLSTDMHFAAVMLAPVLACRPAQDDGREPEPVAPTGALVIHPANVEARSVWSYSRESVIVAIKPASLLELAGDQSDVERVSLRPPDFGTVDPQAFGIAELLKAELAQQPVNELYVDSLFTVFAIHLLRNHSETTKRRPNSRGGLSVRDARRLKEFLRENFSRKLPVSELATLVGLSPFHFIRAFSRTFGEPPHRYVLKLRLAFAEKLLIEGNISIAEIAYLSGFSSQSHLTAVMKKYRHTTPAEIRQNG